MPVLVLRRRILLPTPPSQTDGVLPPDGGIPVHPLAGRPDGAVSAGAVSDQRSVVPEPGGGADRQYPGERKTGRIRRKTVHALLKRQQGVVFTCAQRKQSFRSSLLQKAGGGNGGRRPPCQKIAQGGNSNKKIIKKAQEGSLIALQSGAGDPRNGSDAF